MIPTRNRPASLGRLLVNLSNLNRRFDAVIVVDSSDHPGEIEDLCEKFGAIFIGSKRTSAAHQRNLGIKKAISSVNDFRYIAFLDDDVIVPKDYLERSLESFGSADIIGISGIALNSSVSPRKRNFLKDFLGLTGRPGTLTRSGINIPCEPNTGLKETEWLIGCSVWRREIVERIRFQDDFEGQSLFEDVLFSIQARDYGRLICNTEMVLDHSLESVGRPNTKEHFISWVENRIHVTRIAPEKVSFLAFWTLIFLEILYSLFWSLTGDPYQRQKARGLMQGCNRVWRKSKK